MRLADVEEHVSTVRSNERFLGRYYVASTSGSTGRRGLILWDFARWTTVLASCNRSFAWTGVGAGLTHRTKMAAVSTTTPWQHPGTSRQGSEPQSKVTGYRRCAWTPEIPSRASSRSSAPMYCPEAKPAKQTFRTTVHYYKVPLVTNEQRRCYASPTSPYRRFGHVCGRREGQAPTARDRERALERALERLGGISDDIVVSSLEREPSARGAIVSPVRVRRVASIPKGEMGKAPLLLASVWQPAREEH